MPTVVVGCDSIETSKPDPGGYLAAARRLGVDPSGFLVIEDAPAGVAAGLAAGMTVLTVPPAAHLPVQDPRMLPLLDLTGIRVTRAGQLLRVELP
jgi:sugar-phosphatase